MGWGKVDDAVSGEQALRTLRRFAGLTLALSWGVCGASLLGTVLLSGTARIPAPMLLAAACAPSAAAFALAGVRSLLRRLMRPARSWAWIVALLALPLLALVAPSAGGPPRGMLLSLAFVAPLGEEFGWRGLALPVLLRRFSPATGSLILAAMWIGWHLPAFLVPGVMRQGLGDVAWWALGTAALSCLMTWLHLRGNGNLVLAGLLPHASADLLGAAGLWSYSPAQAALLTILAAALVLLDRRRFAARPEKSRSASSA